ncbi:DUF262 domain-containing protein [Microcoleus sp. N9_B2]|uniref:DUF262 domain-containing protein n=1 Tax=unclassified Microcoleus TaxID=2642155 RepID=UPI002FD4C6FD
MQLAPFEKKMWKSSPANTPNKMSERWTNQHYHFQETSIITEIDREKLPRLVESLKMSGYIEMRSFYQRRARWDATMKSRLIESFILNIPVPSIILYKQDFQPHEVLDGQQRIFAIQEFYENKLKLTGLEILPELNGHTYNRLPLKIRANLDRRSISSIVILAEPTSNPEADKFLKQKTFERLNAARLNFSHQEMRNILYPGKFNELLLKLARNPIFAEAWGIPTDDNSRDLEKNSIYEKMEDAELVLRFFALRNIEHYQMEMPEFLDLYMMKSLNFSMHDIIFLEDTFIETISLAYRVYGQHLFKPFDPQSQTWSEQSNRFYYDATMLGFNKHLLDAYQLMSGRDRVIEATKNLFNQPKARFLTGGGTSKAEIQERLGIFDEMLSQVIGE